MKRFFLLVFCLHVLLGMLWASTLKKEENVYLANRLVFFFDSSTRILTDEQLEKVLSKKGSVSSILFTRILNNRLKKKNLEMYLDKELSSNHKKKYIFEVDEIRDAALAELLDLGNDALEVLMMAIYSSRENVKLGILHALNKYHSEHVLRVYGEVLLKGEGGQYRFSVACRMKAGAVVGKYLNYDFGKKLFKAGLKDVNENVRYSILKSIEMNNKDEDSGYIKIALLEQFKYELSLINGRLAKFKNRGIENPLEREKAILIPLLHLLEISLRYDPQTFAKYEIPEIFLKQDIISKLLIEYESVLPSSLRVELFKKYLLAEGGILAQRKVLSSMNISDKEIFQYELIELLKKSPDSIVILRILKLLEEWGLVQLEEDISKLSEINRRKKVRNLANKISQKL